MTIFSGIIVYLMIFWTALFCILPWGNRADDQNTDGMAGSAPINPRIKQKFIITALLSIVIWGIVFALVEMQVIDWREFALEMVKEEGRL